MPVKRARVGTVKKNEADAVQMAFEGDWQSPDVQQAWNSCLKLLRHTQHSRCVHSL